MINPEGYLVYRNNGRQITSPARSAGNQWHSVIVTHGFLVRKTAL